MDYFEKLALEAYRKNFGNKRGIVTLSMWECDCSGHPYRPYGIVSYLVESNTIKYKINISDSVMYDEVTTTVYNGETLPHVVIFQEIY